VTCGLHPAQPREWVCPARAPHAESRVLAFSALSPLSACHLRSPAESLCAVLCNGEQVYLRGEVVMMTETGYGWRSSESRGDGNGFCEMPISFHGKLAMAWHPLSISLFSPPPLLHLCPLLHRFVWALASPACPDPNLAHTHAVTLLR
jgi:hypothetical protein